MRRAPLRGLAVLRKDAAAAPLPWRQLPAPPRLTPFLRGLRGAPEWQWRALACSGSGHEFELLATVNLRLGQYRAWLLHRVDQDWRLLARLEDHGDHPGLHLHAWCPSPLPDPGTPSINAPDHFRGRPPRRSVAGAMPDSFFSLACATFRIVVPAPGAPLRQGQLL